MGIAIAFHAVTKRFPDGNLGLADATWYIEEGARACLLGPSGSGKTTAIRILQGVLRPTGGSVLVLGVPVDGPDYRSIRRHLGFVPQVPGMYADLTAGQYLALAGRLYGESHERVAESLDLHEYLHTRMVDLSNSFQRRLALAAALVASPDVLVLDEPTAGLDPLAASDLHVYLAHAMEGRTTLLCTHNESEASKLCDVVIRMRGGRVVTQGSWDDLRRRAEPRLRIAARQGADRLLAELENLEMRAEPDGDGVLVDVEDPREDAARLLHALLAAGVDVYECAPAAPAVQGLFDEAYQ